jgi:CHAT domain-containing protein
VLGLPDEDAPRVREECEGLGRRLPGARVHCGEDATSERLRAAASAPVLHVATHGMFREEVPHLAAFRLADGWFGVTDVYGLDLRANLVYLSSCDGGRGGVLRSGEALGLSRAFLHAGARSLLSALGPVRDDAAAAFTDAFYESLVAGATAGDAHRAAAARTRERYPHPAHWASLVLHGDALVYPLGVKR